MPRSQGRTGRPWRTGTAAARARWANEDRPCWVCGQPIDYTLTHAPGRPNRDAVTVDHITPLSQGGDPLNPLNWDAAHFRCNSSRGAGRTGRGTTSENW